MSGALAPASSAAADRRVHVPATTPPKESNWSPRRHRPRPGSGDRRAARRTFLRPLGGDAGARAAGRSVGRTPPLHHRDPAVAALAAGIHVTSRSRSHARWRTPRQSSAPQADPASAPSATRHATSCSTRRARLWAADGGHDVTKLRPGGRRPWSGDQAQGGGQDPERGTTIDLQRAIAARSSRRYRHRAPRRPREQSSIDDAISLLFHFERRPDRAPVRSRTASRSCMPPMCWPVMPRST